MDPTRSRLEACPRFGEHGLIEGCGLCDPARVPQVRPAARGMDLGEREAGPMPFRPDYGWPGDVDSLHSYLRDWHLWRAIQRDACLTYAERGAVIDAIEDRLMRRSAY